MDFEGDLERGRGLEGEMEDGFEGSWSWRGIYAWGKKANVRCVGSTGEFSWLMVP